MERDILIISESSDKAHQSWRLRIFRGLNNKFLWVMNAYLVLSVIELIAFPGFDVAFGILVSFIGIAISRQVLCHSQKLLYYPVSTLALLFYAIFFELLPLPATLLELKPLTYNMRNPYYTFSFLLFTQCILLLIHTFYVRLTRCRNVVRETLNKLGFFTPFSSQEIWFLILGSFIWYVYIMVTRGLYTDDNMNVNSQFSVIEWAINLFFSKYYLILFIFYFHNFNNIKGKYGLYHWLIILLAAAVFIIGIGTNMRTSAISVFANGVFCLVIYLIFYPELMRRIVQTKYVILASVAFLFFIGPFQRLSEAMVAVRYERSGKNAIELIEMTLFNKKVPNYFESQISEQQTQTLRWDERYLDSDFLNRFCSLKILDETLYHALRLNSDQRQEMRISLYAKIVDQLPGVIKGKLGINSSSVERGYSLSDLMHYLSTEKRYYLGGIKIGSIPGLGLALWGYWFPLLLIPVYFIMFYLLDSFIFVKGMKVVVPLFFFASVLDYVALFSDRHYYLYEARFILRGFWETVVVYLITIHIIRRLPFLKH